MTTTLPPRPMTPLRVAVTFPWPDTATVTAAGEIDMTTAPVFGLRLLTVLGSRDLAAVDVDLAGVTFLDCAGIGVLVTVRNAAARVGCRMRLVGPAGTVARLLDLTGVGSWFLTPPVARAADPASGKHRLSLTAQAAAAEAAA